MKIEMEHCRTVEEINGFISNLSKEYGVNVNVINISSTPDGFDLFYNMV